LAGKPEGKRPLRRLRRRRVDNIKTDLTEIGWDGMDWIDLTQNRDQRRALVNTVMNLGFHKMPRSSRVPAQWASSQEGISSMNEIVPFVVLIILCNFNY
jgi:hypothetical protein